MMAKTTTQPKKRYSQALSEQSSPYVRVLSVGHSKSGKTHFSLTFPNLVIANTDAGLASDVEINCKIDPPVFNFVRWNENIGEDELWSWRDLHQLVLELKYRKGNMWDEIKSYGYVPETLVIDSGTGLSDIFSYEITLEEYHKDKSGKHMETFQLNDYNLLGQRFYTILDVVKTLPMHVIMTAELAEKQDDMDRRYQAPAMAGQALGLRLPHYFDEIYLHTKEVEKDNSLKFYLSQLPTRSFSMAGSRKGIPLDPVENPSFAKLSKYYVRKTK